MQRKQVFIPMFVAGLAMLFMASLSGGLPLAHAETTTTSPTASSSSITVNSGVPTTLALTASDANTPALPLTFSIVTNPTNGSISNLSTSTGSLTYTSDSGFSGTDSFTFMVSNGVATSSAAIETITVNPVNSTTTTTSSTSTANTTGTIQIVRIDRPTANLNEGGSFSVTPTLISPSSTMSGLSVMVTLDPQNSASTTYSQTYSNQTLTQGVEANFPLNVTSSLAGNYVLGVTVSNASGTIAALNNLGTVTVLGSTTTSSTSSGTDLTSILARIKVLEDEVADLMRHIGMMDGSNGGSNGTSTVSGTTLIPASATIPAGSSIDFNGRNFGHEEDVRVMMDGSLITTAHADGGGNFTTGSVRISSVGTHAFTFVGQTSGISMGSTVTVQ